jgi:hypothetical protein
MKEGVATKVTSFQTKEVVEQNLDQMKVKQLDLVLDALPDESPSLLVEVVGKGDFMKELKKLKLKVNTLEGYVKKLEEFHSDALDISLRVFLNRMVECFYIHVGKENLGFEDWFRWLRS